MDELFMDNRTKVISSKSIKAYHFERLNDYELNILKILHENYEEQPKWNTEVSNIVIDYINRKYNTELPIVNKEKNNKINKPKITKSKSKKDQIKSDNLDRIITTEIKRTETLSYTTLRSKYLEIRTLTFIQLLQYINSAYNNMHETYIYETFGIIKRFIDVYNCANPLIKYLFELYNEVKDVVKYSFNKVIDAYPKTLFDSDHDHIFPNHGKRLYPIQKTVINNVIEQIDKNIKTMLFYRIQFGMGKTATAYALIKSLASHPNNKNIQYIFCCNVQSVLMQFIQWVLNGGYSIYTYNRIQNENHTLVRNEINLIKQTPWIHAMDMVQTLAYLKQEHNTQQNNNKQNDGKQNKMTVLFFDEPTIALEKKSDPRNCTLARILKYAPQITILSSGTLPKSSDVPELEYYIDRNNIIDIIDRNIFLGCKVIESDGKVFVPYAHCKTQEDINKLIDILTTKPFFTRMFTTRMISHLANQLTNQLNADQLEENYRSYNELANYGLELLVKLKDHNNIGEICTKHYGEVYEPVTMNVIFKDDLNGMMIVTDNPIDIYLKLLNTIDRNYVKKYFKFWRTYFKLSDKEKEKVKTTMDLEINGNICTSMMHFDELPHDSIVCEEVLYLLHAGIGFYDETNNMFDKMYCEFVLMLGLNNRLKYLICDTNICYGSNLKINTIVLDDDLANTHSIESLMQIMARIGRVGLSWLPKVYLTGDQIKNKIIRFLQKEDQPIELENLRWVLDKEKN